MPVGKCAQFSDELMEGYSFGRLPRLDSAVFEEHFLLCEACRQRLSASDEYLGTVKAAAHLVPRKPPGSAPLAIWMSLPRLTRHW